MQRLTRRGIASFGVAALLVLAPITATAAYADDEVVVAEAPVEVVAEAPVQVVAEAPAEFVTEPAVDEVVTAPEVPVEAIATETSVVPEETAGPISAAATGGPIEEGAAARATFTPSIQVTYVAGQPWTLTLVHNELTATWSTSTTYGYRYLFDASANAYVFEGYGNPQISATLTPGHSYYIYSNDYCCVYAYAEFTVSAPPAPNAPISVVTDRLPLADGISLSWAAPVENAENPVTGYSIDVTSNGATTTYTTSDLSREFPALSVGDSYTFGVTAIAADGQRSTIATADTTLQAIAPTVPQNLVLTRSSDILSGTWAAPAYDGGSPIDSYLVGLFADGVGVETEFDVVGNSFTFDTEADYSVEYSFLVVAFSEVGYGSPIGESNAVERPDFAPVTPTAYVSTDAYKNPMVNVYWEFVVQEGSEVESVDVTLYDATGAVVRQETHTVLDGRTNVPFYDLANDTTYTATVVATNAAGSSLESAPVEIRTNGLIPPAYTAEQVALAGNFSNVSVALTGTELVAHIDGLAAGAWVFGHAYSTPSALGWTQVDTAGNARWSISGAGLASGATHTLAVQNSFGELLGSATFAIAAPAVATAALAHTGTDSTSWIAIALAMLVVGAISTATKVRRRARA